MYVLRFRNGIYGKEGHRTNVKSVRVLSEPWDVEGVQLVSITIDFADGTSEPLPEVQNNYWLE